MHVRYCVYHSSPNVNNLFIASPMQCSYRASKNRRKLNIDVDSQNIYPTPEIYNPLDAQFCFKYNPIFE